MPYFLAPLWKTNLSSLSETELWDHFEKCLKVHDWTYSFSDDHGVWIAGKEQKDHLNKILGELRSIDADRANKMYYEACPWLNADGSRRDDW